MPSTILGDQTTTNNENHHHLPNRSSNSHGTNFISQYRFSSNGAKALDSTPRMSDSAVIRQRHKFSRSRKGTASQHLCRRQRRSLKEQNRLAIHTTRSPIHGRRLGEDGTFSQDCTRNHTKRKVSLRRSAPHVVIGSRAFSEQSPTDTCVSRSRGQPTIFS